MLPTNGQAEERGKTEQTGTREITSLAPVWLCDVAATTATATATERDGIYMYLFLTFHFILYLYVADSNLYMYLYSSLLLHCTFITNFDSLDYFASYSMLLLLFGI